MHPYAAYRRTMNRRHTAYFAFRGSSAGIFLLSATVLRGTPAVIGCVVAGMGGILTCIGVNAGGPGEQAGARRQMDHYNEVRAPQGDWPPYDPAKVIEGELAES